MMLRWCLALTLLCACGGEADYEPPPAHDRSLVVLGIDGMDPVLLEKYWAEGKLPNLKALAKRGGFSRLQTSDPPQSPVAWSTFITGSHHDVHGIYDFVHRNPTALEPYLSTSKTEGPEREICLGSFAVPLGSGNVELLRRGEAFWQSLEKARVPARVVKIPANFPPARSTMNPSMSGMGTPDLLGSYGTYQVITDDPEVLGQKSVVGGLLAKLEMGGNRGTARLTGPPNPMTCGGAGEDMTTEVVVIRDADSDAALVRIGDEQVILTKGEWGEWMSVGFDPGMLGGAIPGIARLYLAELRPHVRIYVSPINLDPAEPVMPITSPDGYAPAVAERVGRFYTQGMALDTKALAAGVLSDDEYLAQADLVFKEREKLLASELDEFEGGLFFFYVSAIDLLSHTFWRAIEPDASPEDARYAHVIPEYYQRVDAMIGRVMKKVGPDVPIIVMSDHGFGSYRKKVHLNTWLAQQGYLVLAKEPGEGPLGHIDWSKTQAYALGLNQLFVNQAGREQHGVVDPGQAAGLRNEIARKLKLWRDPESGDRVVTDVVDIEAEGRVAEFGDRAPDLLVGYNRGYRSSDESALGAVGSKVIQRNRDKWSGDHCVDSRLVPGILVTSFPHSTSEPPGLADMAPTILDYFDVQAGEQAGRSLLPKEQ